MATKFRKPSYMTATEEKRWEVLVAKARLAEKAIEALDKEDNELDDRHEKERIALYVKQEKENDRMGERQDAAEDKLTDIMDKIDDLEDNISERKNVIVASQMKKRMEAK